MKSGYSILTRKIKGMDINVWLTLLSIIIISAAIFVYKITKNVECTSYDIFVKDDSGSTTNPLFVGENVTFTVKVKGNVFWDFGDGFQADGNVSKHKFLNYGKQVITVILNGKCNQTKIIDVHKNFVPEPVPSEVNSILGPQTAIIGQPVTFLYVGKQKASSFEWSVVDSRFYKLQRTNKAVYSFFSAGPQKIELQLNNDPHKIYRKSIEIYADVYKPHPNVKPGPPIPIPKPGPKQPLQRHDSTENHSDKKNASNSVNASAAKTYKPETSDADFKRMFEQIAAKERDPQSLNDYLRNGENTKVYAKGGQETVKSICEKLSSGKYKIKSVIVDRDLQHYVRSINIEYSKKGILGL